MELGRARRVAAPRCRVETAETLNLGETARSSPRAALSAVLRKLSYRALCVNDCFPVGAAREVEKSGIEVSVVSESPVAEKRLIKDAAEIRAIRASQNAARAAEKALASAIREAEPDACGRLISGGRLFTSERAKSLIRSVLVAHGTIDEEGTIVAGGLQAADPHESGSGPLRTGQTIVADIFPRSIKTGYWGDMTRTFHHGRLSPELRRMLDTVKEAQTLGIAAVRPGVSGASVHAAVREFFDLKGFKTGRDASGRPYGFIHSTGHGVGLDIHEEPRLSPSGSLLRPGMVVTVEPGLYYPGIGGVRIEDTVLVVPSGCEIL